MTTPKLCAVIDWGELTRFLRSVATAVAIRSHSRLVFVPWETDPAKQSRLMDAVDWIVSRRGETGRPDVQQDWSAIAVMGDQQYGIYLSHTVEKIAEGPAALTDYLREKGLVRARMIEQTQALWREANRINQQKIDSASTILVGLSSVKLASAVTLALLSGGAALGLVGAGVSGGIAIGTGVATGTVAATAAGAGAIAFTYQVSAAIAKNWDEIARADMVALVVDFDKADDVKGELRDEGLQRIGDKAATAAQGYYTNRAVDERNALKKLKSLSRKLGENIDEGKRAQTLRRLDKAAGVAAQAKGAGTKLAIAKIAGKLLPVVFMVKDIKDAVGEHREEMKVARP